MTFQEQINLLRAGDVPLPLLSGQATAQAVRLRAQGLSYGSIAMIMSTYHGWRLGDKAWRSRCRQAGSPGKHHAGRVPPVRRAS